MKESFDHIDDLIGKYLAGEATDQERARVDEWILADKANASYFAHVQLIFDRARKVRANQQFDSDKAWNKVKAQIERGKTIAMFPYRSAL